MKKRHVIKHQFKVHDKGHFGDFKNDMVACAGEFIGTVLFLLFGMGCVQNTSALQELEQADTASRTMAYYYISAAFGLSLFAMASVFYRFTGSIFNPSVSLALVLTGVITPVRFILVGLAQMVGGIVAAAILDGLTPGPLIANVALAQGTSYVQGMFIEMFGTAALTISVLMLAAEKHLMTPMAPLGFGFTLWVVMLFSIQYTGGAINTARAFGPAVIQGFQPYQWIYWVGPTLGALVATAFYIFLKYIKYWQVNPNQDSTNYVDGPMLEVVDAETGSIRTVRTSHTAHTGEPIVPVMSNVSAVPSVRLDTHNTNIANGAVRSHDMV